MLLTRVMSDLHLEFGAYTVPPTDTDHETVLVLAGDTTVASSFKTMTETFIPFIEQCSKQFRAVVLVMGNHEHYNGDFLTSYKKLKDATMHLANIHLLEKETRVIDDVCFIGATLWTDCGNNSPTSSYLWHGMNDGQVITKGSKKLSSMDTTKDHKAAKKFILAAVKIHKHLCRKTVVVVHHAVSGKSVHARYKGEPMNMFFGSDMDMDFMEANPDYVIHGHMHNASRYLLDSSKCISNTEVICNPRGYYGYESTPESRGFDPLLTIEV